MLIVCRGKEFVGTFINEHGKEESLWLLDLEGFTTPQTALTEGTNKNGERCFDDNGRFNGMKMAHCSTFTNTTTGQHDMTYWDEENQAWG